MMDSYIEKMQARENQCIAYINKAEELRESLGKPSKEECIYLQKAAALRYEMAQISVGEERLYQQRKIRDLNNQIKEIIKQVDPESYKAYEDRLKAGKKPAENTSSAGKPAPKPAAGSRSENDVPDESVQGWFKELPNVGFDQVSGMQDVKDKLMECITNSQLGELKKYLHMKNLHSYFFIGPPGCGKTYIIKAFAHEIAGNNYKYMSLEGSDILSRYVGEAEKIVTRLFEEAEKAAPCVVFIDEVDGVCKNRSQPNLPEYAASLTTAFLTGFNRIVESDKDIVFIGATNYPDQVDNAMLDRVELIRLALPDKEAREAKFLRDLGKVIQVESDISFSDMADRTEGYNYRDIERLCMNLKVDILNDVKAQYGDQHKAIDALKNGEFKLTKKAFDSAIAVCLPTPKDDVLKALDAWEAKFYNNREE